MILDLHSDDGTSVASGVRVLTSSHGSGYYDPGDGHDSARRRAGYAHTRRRVYVRP